MVNYYMETMNIQELRSAYSFMMFKKMKRKFRECDKIELDTIIKALRDKEGNSNEVKGH